MIWINGKPVKAAMQFTVEGNRELGPRPFCLTKHVFTDGLLATLLHGAGSASRNRRS